MTEKAIVCGIDGMQVKVMPEQDCKSITGDGTDNGAGSGADCTTCGQCIHGENAGKRKKQAFTVMNKSNLPLKIGDKVEYYIAPGAVILSAISVFVMPFILFAVFYYVGKNFFGMGNTIIPVLCGLTGSAIGFFSMIAIKAVRRQEYLPEIINVIPRNQSDK